MAEFNGDNEPRMKTPSPLAAPYQLPVQPTPPSPTDFPSTFSSTLPLVFVIYPGNGIDLYSKQKVSICVIDNNPDGGASASNPISQLTKATVLTANIHVRGEATAGLQKVQYSVDLDSDPDNPHFLGMKHGGKHWVFNDAGAVDFTYMRNPMAFHMERKLGGTQWAPRTRYFELFLAAGTDVSVDKLKAVITNAYQYYQGIYINMEKVRKRNHRIEIARYTRTDPAASKVGDLILQLNSVDSDYVSLNPGGQNAPNLPALGVNQVLCYEPDAGYFGICSADAPPPIPDPVPAQLQPILTWWNDWAALVAYDGNACQWSQDTFNSGLGPMTPVKSYADTIDIASKLASQFDFNSFAEYFLMAEIAKDPDGYHRSTFMWLSGNTVYAGPMWDKNKSYGNVQNYPTPPNYFYVTTDGWSLFGQGSHLLPSGCPGNTINPNQAPCWWAVLLTATEFCQVVWDTWQDQCKPGGAFDVSAIETYVASNQDLLETSGAAKRDLTLWRDGGTTLSTWEGWIQNTSDAPAPTLFSYLEGRIAWIDANLEALLEATSGFTPSN